MSEQEDFKQAALEYHRQAPAGKIKVTPTKAMVTQRDLALAYSPGVAAACEAIVADPGEASALTARGNLVGVITNGTAVLGLGDIGPLAGKPVMEGKGVLFQKFAGIDVFDLEVNERDPDKLVEIIAALEPTFGGINLEDIKAPECFVVEKKLRERLKIPVFHDDQHGTAIIVGAALINALHVVGKDIASVRLAVSGAGAAGIACLDMMVALGVKPENILVTDRDGVLHTGRADLQPGGANHGIVRYARDTSARTLADIIVGADVFVGVSAGGVLKPEMVKQMAERPVIFALANPTPEIDPKLAREARPDAVIATGRSDFPNQVNNALCFPYIFRGALDVGATTINEEMKLACVNAIADLARREATDLGAAYGGETPRFGADYLIPRPFDPRLLVSLAPAVARAAMDSGVATRPISDLAGYRDRLSSWVFRTGLLMKPVFDRARDDRKRVVYAEGEEETVLRAVQTVVDEGLAKPILVGRPAVIERRIQRLGLRLRIGEDVEVTNIDDDPRFNDYWQLYHEIMQRKGITPSAAKAIVRSRDVVIAALMVRRGEADALLCGLVGRFVRKLKYMREILGLENEVRGLSALSAVINDKGVFFFTDTHVQVEPTAAQVAESVVQAAFRLKLFGITPKAALVSHSNFGSSESASAQKMRDALAILRERAPKLEVEGEMHADIALNAEARSRILPESRLHGRANLLAFANLDAANASYNLVRNITDGVGIGPILMGLAASAHVLTPSATVRRVVNMTAIAAVDAQIRAARG
ncbi:NADP-dependent malic enzyme [Arenimonas caeni]|jgi:malate dehydrogenase (oxaloacetate-decarboxylating)(NADP+)|uniref:NADP-dependent malic enzyme n=1 Tax=Arenimonas caeni TaxID=2058085 RepID=A0A2P6M8R9_9GAMM|nr:NADP-dependent malic enzyme [Arenimonas caeni]MDY0021637.1 NADP-dependent malic enzyme [Arenimonas caeni]PRH82392.1 NADP-dependent malic enzyme [Arenimonas caeni]